MTPRLHVLLGAGGVGKTTLAAGYALALATPGHRVGLLGIDPSRRLQDALGVELADLDAQVPGAGPLRAAIVQPHQAIERWVREACTDRDALGRLEHNPFFAALGDRLATATDVLAAARIVEWVERDPGLTDLVVDTAPGVAAIDFLRSPRHIEALVKGRLIRWLRAIGRTGDGGFRFGARRVVTAFAGLAGAPMVGDLADFFVLVRAPLERMLVRVERARQWLQQADTSLLLVTSPRDTGAIGAVQLASALRDEGLAPRAVIVNRTWPPELAAELASGAFSPDAAAFVAYARAQLRAQAAVLAAVETWAPTIVVLPSRPVLIEARRPALVELGVSLSRALSPTMSERRSVS
ncbi:MAG TPA: ArsA-related P-loop ATPase [Kofleriaceae bacterium]